MGAGATPRPASRSSSAPRRSTRRVWSSKGPSVFSGIVRRGFAEGLDIVANVGKRTIPGPAVFNHEPGATTSRVARSTRSPLPLAQSLPALARVIVVRVNPVLAGLCRRARHESAQARHENLYPLSSMARKRCRGFIERASRHEGLVDLNASDKIDVREGACPHAPCALRLLISVVRECSEGFNRFSGSSGVC